MVFLLSFTVPSFSSSVYPAKTFDDVLEKQCCNKLGRLEGLQVSCGVENCTIGEALDDNTYVIDVQGGGSFVFTVTCGDMPYIGKTFEVEGSHNVTLDYATVYHDHELTGDRDVAEFCGMFYNSDSLRLLTDTYDDIASELIEDPAAEAEGAEDCRAPDLHHHGWHAKHDTPPYWLYDVDGYDVANVFRGNFSGFHQGFNGSYSLTRDQ